MSSRVTRRGFLKEGLAGGAALVGLGACARTWSAAARDSQWHSAPRLDGALLLDEAQREQLATDLGAHALRMPAAVLRPRSAQDIATMIRFAHARRLPVAMRGRGHSQYGQTLVEGGIVVDSTTLNAVTVESNGTVYAQAGASWDEVTRATLEHGLTLPALGDTMSLSVGGILSAGGIGNTSHRQGAVVDNVVELEVVTGTGDVVTCSPRRNGELFDLALGGMGQCALIVGARLRLVPAPNWVVQRDLFYDDLKTFLSDLRRLATNGRAEHLGAHVLPPNHPSGRKFRIDAGTFSVTPEADFAPIEVDLHFISMGGPVGRSYPSYLHREDARNAAVAGALKETPRRLLYLTMFLPDSTSEEFLAQMLATREDTAGVHRFSLYMLPRRNFHRPMFVLPSEELVLGIFLFRAVPALFQAATGAETSRYADLVATVRSLAERMRVAGGKAYPPYAPFYSVMDWQAHYGTVWHRLTSGKRMFDPRNLLTPGMRLFATAGGA